MIDYPYLPKGRSIKYVTMENPFMKMAFSVMKEKSADTRQPVGSVIVKNGVVVASAANLSGFKNKKLIELHSGKWCIRKLLKIRTGKSYWLCPGCANHKDHSENSACTKAQKAGIDTKGADLYLYGHWWCCKPCWDKMIEVGIKDVYLLSGSEKLFRK